MYYDAIEMENSERVSEKQNEDHKKVYVKWNAIRFLLPVNVNNDNNPIVYRHWHTLCVIANAIFTA